MDNGNAGERALAMNMMGLRNAHSPNMHDYSLGRSVAKLAGKRLLSRTPVLGSVVSAVQSAKKGYQSYKKTKPIAIAQKQRILEKRRSEPMRTKGVIPNAAGKQNVPTKNPLNPISKPKAGQTAKRHNISLMTRKKTSEQERDKAMDLMGLKK